MVDQNVLLVEDSPEDALFMGRAFSRAQLHGALFVVRDGEEAISFLARTGVESPHREPLPHLVLLDLKLPKKSGLEVLEWIRKQPQLKHLPVVVLTSSKENVDLKRAYELGANSFLVKPVGLEPLFELVEALKHFWLQLNQTPRPQTPQAGNL